MPRYELRQGTSQKFWQIDLDGTSFTTTYGRIGTDGQSTTKAWKDPAAARKEHDKLVAEKTKKGYVLVGAAPAAAARPAAAKPAAAKAVKAAKAPAGRGDNGTLEDAIDRDPDDTAAWAVYIDWLQSQGDPRGELGAVQERLAASPKDKALLSAEKKLLKQHGDFLLGKLRPAAQKSASSGLPGVTARAPLPPDARSSEEDEPPLRLRWRAGFISSAFVAYPGDEWEWETGDEDDDGPEEVEVGKLLTQLLDVPAARFLTGLTLGVPQSPEDGENDYEPVLKRLVKHPAAARLRQLYIGDFTQEQCEVSWMNLGDLSKLWPALPRLRSLTLRGGSEMKLGAIDLPELRELTIITGGLDRKNLAAICAARWPKLEKLELWLGDDGYGANTTPDDLEPILRGDAFPALRHLGIRNSEIIDAIAALLPDAPIVKRLEALDLSKGTLTDAGVEALAARKGALAHLTRIDLSDNYLEKSDRLATSLCKQVRTKPQRQASSYDGETHRYVALGE